MSLTAPTARLGAQGADADGAVRVLLVDDSTVVRHVVSDVLRDEPGITLVGVGVNGRDGVDRIAQLKPHVVILDVEMPEMTGHEALAEIRRRWPKLPVIMYSTLTERGAAATLDALAGGANDYLTKPTMQGTRDKAIAMVRESLVPLVRFWGSRARRGGRIIPTPITATPIPVGPNPGVASQIGRQSPLDRPAAGPATARPGRLPATRLGPTPRPGPPAHPDRPVHPLAGRLAVGPATPGRSAPMGSSPGSTTGAARATAPVAGTPGIASTRRAGGTAARVSVLIIASSTGGPNALAELVPQLPANLAAPVLLVQHMPPTFTRLLAERLDGRSAITVVEAEAGLPVRPGHLYVARGGVHMSVAGKPGAPTVQLEDGPAENSCKPAADVLFRSAAQVWGREVLAVVLTGMGQDGLAGGQAVVAAGGSVIAQDEATSVVWGMPGAIARAGIASEILPLGRIAESIVRRVSAGRGAPR